MREMSFHIQIKQVGKEYSKRNNLGERSSPKKNMVLFDSEEY
jgi:hypothetical protein